MGISSAGMALYPAGESGTGIEFDTESFCQGFKVI
ncbi:hypothetical protein SAMN06264348_101237 [Oceanospirillum linum]|nr:hypothetical protein SAMN04489856_101236 [Oleiphilus messinensis]SMP02105.1 hypothetical protein SAMN06264348_101237 [Oceanospirillum linum]